MKKLLMLTLVSLLAVTQVQDAVAKKGDKSDKDSSSSGKKSKKFAREYDIPEDVLSDEAQLETYLKEQRSKHLKKGKTALESYYNILVANTSNQSILVHFENGLTPGDVALIVVGGVIAIPAAWVAVGAAAGAVSLSAAVAAEGVVGAEAAEATTIITGLSIVAGVSGGVAAGGAGAVAAGATEASSKSHLIEIEPNTFRVFHREKTVDKISFHIRPYNKTSCPKGSKHLKLSMNDKHTMVIVTQTDGCSISSYNAISAKSVDKQAKSKQAKSSKDKKDKKGKKGAGDSGSDDSE